MMMVAVVVMGVVVVFMVFLALPSSTQLRMDEIPKEMRVESEERRLELIEHLSNVDDTIGEMFLGV